MVARWLVAGNGLGFGVWQLGVWDFRVSSADLGLGCRGAALRIEELCKQIISRMAQIR